MLVLVACRPTAPTTTPIADAPASPPSTVVDPPAEPVPEPPPDPDPPPVAEPVPPPAHVAPVGFSPIPAKRKKGFPGVAFTSVRAFAFDLHVNGAPTCSEVLAADGATCTTVEEPGVELSQAQVDRLLVWVRNRKNLGSGSACWLPHHGFVFYDAAGVPVAELAVCFMCEMMSSSPAIPGARHDGETGARYGLSPKGTAELRLLCEELGLPKCDATHPEQFAAP